MKRSSEKRKFFILILLLVVPGIFLILLSKADHKFSTLPYYGPKEVVAVSGSDVPDTIYHEIPDFNFISQDGEEISWEDFKGDIVVADFFFTSCPTICPIMTKQMARLQWMLDDPAFDNVKFLSHTVNPEYDTPEVLKKYGERHHADFDRWTFVTGPKEEIFEQGFQGYLLSTQEDQDAAGGFLHSSMFVLVDKDRRIRGFYDGTSAKEVDDLATDIRMLIKEEGMKESEKIAS